MSGDSIQQYLLQLAVELRKRGVFATRFMEETRGHLADAVEGGHRRGLSQEDAQREALDRFGDPATVAAKFAAEKYRALHWVLLFAAVALGLAIAWMDSRPHWDDAGITAGCLFLSAGLLGSIGPRRPWLWALGIGLWVPLVLLVRTPNWSNGLGGLVILAIPMAGAFAGMAVRRVMAAVTEKHPGV